MAEGFAERAGFPLPGVAPEMRGIRAKPYTGASARPPVFASIGPHGHRQRMRERLLARGPGSLADYEVLEMLLFLGIRRGDTKPLAKAAINRFGSLRDVLLAPAEGFVGLFDRDAVLALKLVVQAADRLARAEARERPTLRDWDGLDAYLVSAPTPAGAGRARVLFLNNRNQLLSDEVLDVAAEDPAAVASETVRRALALHATALILVLGRDAPPASPPDGPRPRTSKALDPERRRGPPGKSGPAASPEAGTAKPSHGKPGVPTKADLALAARLKQAAGVLSIALHDVLLAGGGAYTSLRRKGML